MRVLNDIVRHPSGDSGKPSSLLHHSLCLFLACSLDPGTLSCSSLQPRQPQPSRLSCSGSLTGSWAHRLTYPTCSPIFQSSTQQHLRVAGASSAPMSSAELALRWMLWRELKMRHLPSGDYWKINRRTRNDSFLN